MFFNPGITKQAPDIIFSCKNRKSGSSHCLFNEAPVAHTPKLACVLPTESLITIYNLFVRPHIDYGDITYDQPNNDSFCNMTEKVQ